MTVVMVVVMMMEDRVNNGEELTHLQTKQSSLGGNERRRKVKSWRERGELPLIESHLLR